MNAQSRRSPFMAVGWERLSGHLVAQRQIAYAIRLDARAGDKMKMRGVTASRWFVMAIWTGILMESLFLLGWSREGYFQNPYSHFHCDTAIQDWNLGSAFEGQENASGPAWLDQPDWLDLRGAFAEFIKVMTLFCFAYDVSPTSDELVYTRGGYELFIGPPSGKGRRLDSFASPITGLPRFSPDGKQVAYLVNFLEDKPSFKERSGVYLYDLKTYQKRQIYQGYAHNLLFTQDERWIILEREDGVYLLSLTGKLFPTWAKRIASYNISRRGELCVEVDESPYYVIASWQELADSNGKALALSRMDRHPLRHVVESSSGRIAWSPKGNRIAYVRRSSEHISEVYISDSNGIASTLLIRQVGSLIDFVRWSSSGDKIFFLMLTPVQGGYEGSVWCMDIRAESAFKVSLFH
jgi:hypothetical protein